MDTLDFEKIVRPQLKRLVRVTPDSYRERTTYFQPTAVRLRGWCTRGPPSLFEFINALRLGVFAVEYSITYSIDYKDRH